MSYVDRITATLPARREAGKEAFAALQSLRKWSLNTQKDPQGDTLRAVELAMKLGDPASARRAYGLIGVLKDRAPDMIGPLEAIQDELMDRIQGRGR